MSAYPRKLAQLIEALRCLPGVGPKSATRMAFHLVERDRAGAGRLAAALTAAVAGIGRCERCRNLAEGPLCAGCADPQRDDSLLCVVETPADVAAIEHATGFRGRYFVLMGKLSPLDGIGPRDIGAQRLIERACDGVVREVILATNFTAEGEATAHVIGQALRSRGLVVTRLARGVPAGSELEYVDLGTIAHALVDRREK